MNPALFNQMYKEARELFEQGLFEQMVVLLQRYPLSVSDLEESKRLLTLFDGLPSNYCLENIPAANLYARLLRCAEENQKLIAFAQQFRNAHGLEASSVVQSESAAAWNRLFDYNKAYEVLSEAIPHLPREELGIALARQGFSAFNLKQPWQHYYENAVALLSGEELGRALLNYGYCLSMSNQSAEARQVWLEALMLFKNSPYFLVWTRYNLATIALSNFDPETERHLLAAIEQMHNPKAQELRATVWLALGKFRSHLGEWNRAEFAFRLALKQTSAKYDRRSAYYHLARSKYLSGHLEEALETIEAALQEPDLERHMLYVAQAKVYLKLGSTNRARITLEKADRLKFELEEWSWRIANAELARQEGRLEEAVNLLDGLPTHTLHSREEARQFPQLFELLRSVGRPTPELLEYVQGTTVTVQAQGVLRVEVNGRKVDITPTGRVGELLVFLLERGGAASLDAVEEALYSGLPYAKRRRQAIWNLVDKLREALGWQNSVLALRGIYQLDHQAVWRYDIAEARQRGEFSGEFLAGVYTDWVLEVGRELQELASPIRRKDLN